MYLLTRLNNATMSPNRPLESGPTQEKSNVSKPRVDIDDTTSLTPQQTPQPELTPSTLEFHLQNNETTLIVNPNTSNPSIQDTRSSQTSEVESTSTGKTLKRFWKESSLDVSRQLWLPTETALQDSDLSYLSGFSKNKVHSSFVIEKNLDPTPRNFQRTSLRSSPCSPQDTMEKESIERSKMYTRKIRVYPTPQQKQVFSKWFGCSRVVWNRCLDWIWDHRTEDLDLTNHVFLRDHTLLNNQDVKGTSFEWMTETPYDIRQSMLAQLASNFKTCFTQLRLGLIQKFRIHKKRKKNPKQTCFLNPKFFNLNTLRLCPRYLKEPLSLKRQKNIRRYQREISSCDSQITLLRESGRYYLCFPLYHDPELKQEEKRLKAEKRAQRKEEIAQSGLSKEEFTLRKKLFKELARKIYKRLSKAEKIERRKPRPKPKPPETKATFPYGMVALDPGIVSFQTFYSNEGICGKLGDKLSFDLLRRYGQREDKLKSLLTKHPKRRTRYNMKRRCSLLRTKIKNIVSDLHWKSVSFLTKNFQHILLPSFEVKQMTSKKLPRSIRKLSSTTVRRMLSLSHYRFQERMKYMCALRGNSLYIVNEAYTSVTCGQCGSESKCSGRTYICNRCGLRLERDYNGSRNIFLKHMDHTG